MNSNKYVALDVNSASIVAKVHNDAGKCVMESILETKGKTVRARWLRPEGRACLLGVLCGLKTILMVGSSWSSHA